MIELEEALRRKEIWAIGGGKGGIGKSLITGNVGICLARLKKKVLLVGADLGGTNLHTTLGIGLPEMTLSDFLNRRAENIQDVIIKTGIQNLSLISGAQDFLDAANPNFSQKTREIRMGEAAIAQNDLPSRLILGKTKRTERVARMNPEKAKLVNPINVFQ